MAESKIKNPYAVPSLPAPSSGTDFNSLTEQCRYQIGNVGIYGHAPTGIGSTGSLEIVWVNSYIRQVCMLNNGMKHRFSFDNGSTWTSWV